MKTATPSRRALAVTLTAALVIGLSSATITTAFGATQNTLDLRVLLIGSGSGDVTTGAWESALTNEGAPYTEVDATGASPAETVALPALSSGTTGFYNGVVIAGSPTDFAAGALSALDTYESTFRVNQVDGYMYPDPALGATDASVGALDGATGNLTAAGLAAFPELKGPVPFATGTYGYGATFATGGPYTALITNSAGALAGVYQHPSTDPQAGVAELSLYFDYNASQLQWLLLAPGLINWVTQGTHLGLYRSYFGQDIDDNFIADNEWSSQYQCTPGATEPSDYTCPALVANNPADTPPDVQMTAADVAYVVAWEQTTGIKLNMLFNGIGACTAPTATAESSANCTGSVTDSRVTYTDPGQVLDSSYPNDAALVNALLANQADFNWTIHTWSHLFLGCIVWQPQLLTSATANGSGGTFTAGSYNYEITAATAYGESEPSLPKSATVLANGSVTLTWPEASNGVGANGTPGPTLAQLEASHSGGTGSWGYNIYREAPGSTIYGLVGQVPENTSATSSTTYSFTDTGSPAGEAPGSSDTFPTATDPGIDCSSAAASWLPATSTAADSSIEQEIGLDQAFAAANGLTNYASSAVVTGEHSGLENPNMTAAFAATGITTFGADASRQPQPYSLGTALSAPRYPSNIYYNASNWPDELNEYNTLYVASGDSVGNPTYTSETGHCGGSPSTTCLTAPLTEAGVLKSESAIMLSHVLDNNPRVGYAHQSNLIGPATQNGQDYGYTILDLIGNMLTQYNAMYNAKSAPLVQVNDVTDAQTLAEQGAWTTALGAAAVSATDQNGVVTIVNGGTGAINVPVTVPPGTTVSAPSSLQSYGGVLSNWLSLAGTSSQTLTENSAPLITSAASATANVGTPFTFSVSTTGTPAPAISQTGALPAGLSWTDNGNGTATIAGAASSGSGGVYALTITASSSAGSAVQSFILTTTEAPSITSPATATFTTTVAGTYAITTTGYPTPALAYTATTLTGTATTLPTGLSFTDNGKGTGTISGTPAAGSQGTYNVTLSATNASGSTATLPLTLTVNAAAAPAITSGTTAYFTLNTAGSFAIATTGAPTPAISETGALPAGLTYTPLPNGTATIIGDPTATGTTELTIGASNGISPDATQTLTVIVGQAPAFTSAASAGATVATPFSFTVSTSGYPAPSMGETGSLPTGVTFVDNDNGTATISGTPTESDLGAYPVSLTAINGTASATQNFTLTVGEAPSFSSPNSATALVGTAFTFAVTDAGSPVPTFTETGSLPTGVTFVDNGNGTAGFAGTPAAGTGGVYALTITATNPAGSATQAFTLTVDEAPSITSANTATFAAKNAGSFSVSAHGYPLPSLTETGALPSGVSFSANAAGAATLAGTPVAGTQGTYPITITATGTGSATQSFTLVVNSGLTITSASTATATAGTAFSFSVTATGTPAPTLTRTGTLPAGVTFTANTNGTATLAGTPAATDSGTYSLTFTARNSTGTASQAFTLIIDQVPSFSSAASATETAGTAFSFLVSAKGFPAPTVASGALPAGVSFSAPSTGTGTLSGSSTVTAGTYPLTFSATSGSNTATQSFTLTVKAAGTTVAVPSFTSSASYTATAGEAFTFTVTTTGSPDVGYTTRVTHSGTMPAGVSFSNRGNGTATISGTPSAASGGTYTITLAASNSAGATTQTFVLTVDAAPAITTAASATATDGAAFNFTVKAAGAPAPAMTESGSLPAGLTWADNANGTATLSGTIGTGQGGVYKLSLGAKNTFGSATQAFTLTVDQAPAITSASSASATHGHAFSFSFTSVGYPLPTVTHSGTVRGLTYTRNTNGTATLSGAPTTAGTYSLTITATNSVGSATQTFTLKVA